MQERLAVIGGGGRVGLPLALAFADTGLPTLIYDIDRTRLAAIQAGRMPFAEEGAQDVLTRVLAKGMLQCDDSPKGLAECRYLVFIIGTPVDEHLNPSFTGMKRAIDACLPHLRDGQIVILRSTVFPGISEFTQRYLNERGLRIDVAFCPERVAEGYSLREFRELPQIISAFEPSVVDEARRLFSRLTGEFVEMRPMEAELCKLMTNAWRYIQFATVNQFYMIASRNGLDYDAIQHGCRYKYPRMAGMPGPGLAAGPCLVKDTMQLAAYSENNFVLGHAAMLINEGLPMHLVELARRQIDLTSATTGVLGMAFKAECDDPRDSLSYKLRKILTIQSRRVLCCDPYVPDPSLVPIEQVLDQADVLFVGAPHKAYRSLHVPEGKILIDVWNCIDREPGPSAAS